MVHAWVSELNPVMDPPPTAPPTMDVPVVISTGRWVEAPERTWMREAWSRWEGFASAMDSGGVRWWIWPRAGDVVSDVPSTLAFARAHTGVSILLDPVSLLTGSMMGDVEDHLSRVFEVLGGHGAVGAVGLWNLAPGSDVEGVRVSPVHRGVIRPRLLGELWRRFAPGARLVLLDESRSEQWNVLGEGAISSGQPG